MPAAAFRLPIMGWAGRDADRRSWGAAARGSIWPDSWAAFIGGRVEAGFVEGTR
ncbi:hypothetical protein BURPS406E_D0136 [Burkholderia pseudomallei 406e]|nr:hypothetical protein BURPS406E_D0136 [Burkholderia pseudomallei 406e]VUD68484.1 hypothetical protein UKMH10_6062 [Burkholderia pseudomallei]